MKILSVEQIREADAYTIKHEPVKSIDLMERAASNCFNWIIRHVKKNQKILVYCGLGNNAGDGLVIARLLANKNYTVEICVIRYSDKCSEDFIINYKRLEKIRGIKIYNISEKKELILINKNDVVVDAIFGSGLSKPIKGFIADVIEYINNSKATVISIDMPSGLFGDENTCDKTQAIIKANYTLSLQFPKYCMMFSENNEYVGNIEIIPIGLHSEFINQVDVRNYFIERDDIRTLYKPRNKYDHKGNFGHALLIAGSYGKIGAAVLGARACLRAGVGLLTVCVPKCGYEIIQTAVPEAMLSVDANSNELSVSPDIFTHNAVAVGPGIGNNEQTAAFLKELIRNISVPVIFDADAINIFGKNKKWVSIIPANSIFTPHPKEFERLVGVSENDFHRNQMQREFSVKHNVYIILKGAHTAVTCPDGTCYFNSTGNPGMATAGSGDVLTGILLALISQGYNQKSACLMGVYLHGLAGDIAAKMHGYESMIADDIIMYLGKAFSRINK